MKTRDESEVKMFECMGAGKCPLASRGKREVKIVLLAYPDLQKPHSSTSVYQLYQYL